MGKLYENYLEENNISKIKLNRDTILYNFFEKDQGNIASILKMMVWIKSKIIEKKRLR